MAHTFGTSEPEKLNSEGSEPPSLLRAEGNINGNTKHEEPFETSAELLRADSTKIRSRRLFFFLLLSVS